MIQLQRPKSNIWNFPLLGNGLNWAHIPVKDEKPPDSKQVEEFIEVINKAKVNNEVFD